MKTHAFQIKSSLKIILMLSAFFYGCSSNVEDLRQNQSSRDLTSADGLYGDDETLRIPNQTTGTFLTMNCKWAQREGYAKNKILCRFEGEGGKKAVSDKLSVNALVGDKDVTEKVDTLGDSDFWNVEITIDKDHTSGVDVAYYVDGDFKERRSVDMLLLSNKGVMSIRPVDKTILIDNDLLSGLGIPVSGELGAIGETVGAISSILPGDVPFTGSSEGIELILPERKAFPEVLCHSDGRNLIVTEEIINRFDSIGPKKGNETDYYWDPNRFYQTLIRDADFLPEGFGTNANIESLADSLAQKMCEDITEDGSAALRDKCSATREKDLGKPILNSTGFCLKSVTYFPENATPNKKFCDVAIFDKKTASDQVFYMGFGKERMNEINADLKANSHYEAVKMYIRSFDKCEDFAEYEK